MNFLSSRCLLHYGSVKMWLASCCRQLLPTVMVYDERPYKKRTCTPSYNKYYFKICPRNHVKNLNLYTQVRFKNDHPRLHRDAEFPNFDYYRKDQFKDINRTSWNSGYSKQGITAAIGFFGSICGMYGLKSELTHLLTYMSAAADVLALASIEVDVSAIPPGNCSSYKWRGKPLFIKHRTEHEISIEVNTPASLLKDPQPLEQRMVKQEWLVVIGICTHLGCVPIPNSGDYVGGFYCPCHGSHYDNAGRARKGPAPLNLEVPSHRFVSDTVILVGE